MMRAIIRSNSTEIKARLHRRGNPINTPLFSPFFLFPSLTIKSGNSIISRFVLSFDACPRMWLLLHLRILRNRQERMSELPSLWTLCLNRIPTLFAGSNKSVARCSLLASRTDNSYRIQHEMRRRRDHQDEIKGEGQKVILWKSYFSGLRNMAMSRYSYR